MGTFHPAFFGTKDIFRTLLAALIFLQFFGTLSFQQIASTPAKETCFMEADPGPCKENHANWYFSPWFWACKRFTYGGCGGNSNRFKTSHDCFKHCSGAPEKCFLERDQGPCREKHPKWFFNLQSQTCETFEYGGCGGNDNRFETLRDCLNICSGTPDRCVLPADPGQCNKLIRRFYYDVESITCKHFNYSGCAGNGNRFENSLSCNRACAHLKETCYLPVDPGSGSESKLMWYYDVSSHTCKQFSYGGLEGNNNRFGSALACSNSCNSIFDASHLLTSQVPYLHVTVWPSYREPRGSET